MTSIPAAQYLRVSTERQEYSLDCQSARIADYAQKNGFAVYQTYCDEAKSGLEIGRRAGLSQLLQDVVGGKQSYKAVLVFDVSRWGRFQDPDEAAHYEFLCKAAGVRVHYCAEQFTNDGHAASV
jgi:DNA invertase Pin-like site-specific DNA recombinase